MEGWAGIPVPLVLLSGTKDPSSPSEVVQLERAPSPGKDTNSNPGAHTE